MIIVKATGDSEAGAMPQETFQVASSLPGARLVCIEVRPTLS